MWRGCPQRPVARAHGSPYALQQLTTKGGLIQGCERWTNLGDAIISGDTTLLKQFTAAINEAYDELLAIIFSSDSKWQWDDSNHDDQPIAALDLESGRADYTFISDEDGNSILELRAAYLQAPNGTSNKLSAVDAEQEAGAIFAQNTGNVGTPTRYDKIGATVWLDPVPKLQRVRTASVSSSRAHSPISLSPIRRRRRAFPRPSISFSRSFPPETTWRSTSPRTRRF